MASAVVIIGSGLPAVAPILHASKVLVVPPMQVTIKTPAYPLQVAA